MTDNELLLPLPNWKFFPPQCKVCGKKCYTICTHCRQVFYCCVEHQKQDFDHHISDDQIGARCELQEISTTPLTVPIVTTDGFILYSGSFGSHLSKGASGTVFAMKFGEKQVATKIIPRHVKKRDGSFYKNTFHVVRDIELTHLEHPNIITVRGVGYLINSEKNAQWTDFSLVMDIASCTLQQYMKERKNIPPQDAKILFYQLVRAIRFMHENLVLNLDIKPSNIMLAGMKVPPFTGRGQPSLVLRPLIIDLGLSKSYTFDGIPLEKMIGTAGYMAPEIERKSNRVCSHKSDVWSLGCVIFETLTGRKYEQTQDIDGIAQNDYIKDLLKGMLDDDVEKRMSIFDVIKHQYFDDATKMYIETVLPPIRRNPIEIVFKQTGIRPLSVLDILDTKSTVKPYLVSKICHINAADMLIESSLELAVYFKVINLALVLLHTAIKNDVVPDTNFWAACFRVAEIYRTYKLDINDDDAEIDYESQVLRAVNFNVTYVTAADYLEQYFRISSTKLQHECYILCTLMQIFPNACRLHPAQIAKHCMCYIEKREIVPPPPKNDILIINGIMASVRDFIAKNKIDTRKFPAKKILAIQDGK